MIIAVTVAIFGDMRIDQIQDIIIKRRIIVLNVRPPGAKALHLRHEQYQSRLELFMYEVVIAGLSVFRDCAAHSCI